MVFSKITVILVPLSIYFINKIIKTIIVVILSLYENDALHNPYGYVKHLIAFQSKIK